MLVTEYIALPTGLRKSRDYVGQWVVHNQQNKCFRVR